MTCLVQHLIATAFVCALFGVAPVRAQKRISEADAMALMRAAEAKCQQAISSDERSKIRKALVKELRGRGEGVRVGARRASVGFPRGRGPGASIRRGQRLAFECHPVLVSTTGMLCKVAGIDTRAQ